MSTPAPTDDPEAPVLTGQRVALRPLRTTDAVALHAVYGDPEAMRYWSSPPTLDLPATRARVDGLLAGVRDGHSLQWALARPGAPQAVGRIALLRLDRESERAELGYMLARRHWGQGLMAEAQRLVLAHAFEVLGLHRIEAFTDPRNQPSVRSLERLGFQREGLLRERWLVAGERSDDVCFGLLAPEWASRPAGH